MNDAEIAPNGSSFYPETRSEILKGLDTPEIKIFSDYILRLSNYREADGKLTEARRKLNNLISNVK